MRCLFLPLLFLWVIETWFFQIHFNNIQYHWSIITKTQSTHVWVVFDKRNIEITFQINLRKIISLDSINTFSFILLEVIEFLLFIWVFPVPLQTKIYFNLGIKKFVNLLEHYGRVICKQIFDTKKEKFSYAFNPFNRNFFFTNLTIFTKTYFGEISIQH